MLSVSPDQVREIFVKACNDALASAHETASINGFAFAFDVVQDKPTYSFAFNTTANGPASAFVEDWNVPPTESSSERMLPAWKVCYAKLHEYLQDDDDAEHRFKAVHTQLCDAMKEVRRNWLGKLPGCVFTIAEPNDTEQFAVEIYEDINDIRVRSGRGQFTRNKPWPTWRRQIK